MRTRTRTDFQDDDNQDFEPEEQYSSAENSVETSDSASQQDITESQEQQILPATDDSVSSTNAPEPPETNNVASETSNVAQGSNPDDTAATESPSNEHVIDGEPPETENVPAPDSELSIETAQNDAPAAVSEIEHEEKPEGEPEGESEGEPEEKPEPEQEPQPASSMPMPQKSHPKHLEQTIVEPNEKVGIRLRKRREATGISIADIARKLIINESVVLDIEEGDFDSLFTTFNDGGIFIVSYFKDICGELGISKNETDELVEQLCQEMEQAGHGFGDYSTPSAGDGKDKSRGGLAKTPIAAKLPQYIIISVILICAVIIVLSVLIPYVKKVSHVKEPELDFGPLVQPRQSAPLVLPVPK